MPISRNQALRRGRKFTQRKAFTLVELMVVISILSILSIIGLTTFRNVSEAARVAKLQSDFKAIEGNIVLARQKNNQVLGLFTGNWCSACNGACRPPNYTNDPTCIQAMKATYATITTAEMPLDPWGGAYLIDEDEMEPNYIPCCTSSCDDSARDYIFSGGPTHTISALSYSPPFVYKTNPFVCIANGSAVAGQSCQLPVHTC